MADDRISLNLVLNEATVSAVEGRVRNLVNRLNNQNISLNINGRNLDNITNRLNTIQQQMQRLNNTTVNINANLTQAQQQYRLETERLRVSQQLELSRQRTLQTENQALTAMYNQNRTLNINNNVTHQIEQGVQNVGNNMNVAGGYANDFVSYLANGIRYLAAYRTLEVVMNNAKDAFEEMKNVDKAVISVKKTTGMSDDEVENIRQSSYGVATEYGRTASEYLESVSEFARAGYKEQSAELGKISLLTQNVGDVSAESADKMLLAVDAAYKLKGNVAELTDVVNGLNNIANLNPTSIQKMADGIQVSASMAQVAGLEISDLVALVGTGTAVTQREGSEIARAIRTIIMNIRQVKGELDDGIVIDDDSIAKAEKALEGIGIATKEVVNGVRELRDPMEILDELAGKWSTLNTEAQSVVLESLANKRQANVLAAILENYEMVGKMQAEYFNSANSAIKENELYLQGWEATSNRVSAKWTEYIANMADTSLITGSLNALYGVLVALDTPIGRIATQVILVNTALAVTGRLWTAIRARSVIADVLALGVAERNLGGAIQLVTSHLGRQALAFASSPLGMATIVVTGITLITSAIEKNSQKLEENAQKASEALEKSKSDLDKLDTLIKKYNDLQLSNEWDNATVEDKKQLHEEINQLLGDEADKIDIINGKYKETTEELFKQRMAKLPEEEKTAFDNEQAKGKTLWDKVYWNNGISTAYTSVLSDEEEEFLNKYAHIFDTDNTTINGESVHSYQLSFDSFQDFMHKYDEAKKMLQDMYDEGLGESELYKDFNEYVAQFDTKVTEYRTAVDELEKTKAGQKLANYINQNVGGYIDSLEEYNQVVDWIKDNFINDNKDNAITFLNSYFSEYADEIDSATQNTDKAVASLDNLETASESVSSLSTAFKELSDDGYITIETISKIQKATGLSGDTWEDYQNKLLSAKKGSAEFNQILSDLTYKILENAFAEIGLENATEGQISAVLRENGVTNASEVAHSALTRAIRESAIAKAEEALATYDGTEASYKNAEALITQCGNADIANQAMVNLKTVQDLFSNSEVDVESKIQALQSYGAMAGWTAQQLAMVANGGDVTLTRSVDEKDGKMKWWTNYYAEDKDKNGELDYLYSEEFKGFEFKIPDIPNPTIPNYSSFSSAKDTAKKIEDAKEKIADIQEQLAELDKEEKLDNLKNSIENVNLSLSSVKDTINGIGDVVDNLFEGDFAGKFELISKQFQMGVELGKQYRAEFERLAQIQPESADEANELASRLETLGSSIRENAHNLVEYTKQLNELRVTAVTTYGANSVEQLSRELSLIESNINALTEGSVFGDSFSFDFLFPSIPESAVEKQRDQNKQMLAEEEKYNDEILEIKQKALELEKKENDEAREKERAELLKSLKENQKIIEDASKKSQDTIARTSTSVLNIVSETANSGNKVLDEFEKKINTAAENTKTVLGNLETFVKSLSFNPNLKGNYALSNKFAFKYNDEVKNVIQDFLKQDNLSFEKFQELYQIRARTSPYIKLTEDELKKIFDELKKYMESIFSGMGGGNTSSSSTKNPFAQYGVTSDMQKGRVVMGKESDHKGVDYGLPMSTPVPTPVGGIVRTGVDPIGFGNYVVVTDSQGYQQWFGHLSKSYTNLNGQSVKAGTIIGLSGSTGRSTGPHLHYEIRTPDGGRLHPDTYLAKRASGGIVGKGETTLVNELGQESAILPNGKFVLLGKEAKLVDMPIGTQVINHKDTADILKYTGNSINNTPIQKLASGNTVVKLDKELMTLGQGGTVNLLVRPQIDTSELKKVGWSDVSDGVATIFSSTYSNEDGTIALNFTPIIADPETGEYLGVLSPDELQSYAEGVIAGTQTDNLNLQIGSVFTGENAINDAVSTAEKIHQIHEEYFTDNKTSGIIKRKSRVFQAIDEITHPDIENKSVSGQQNGISNVAAAKSNVEKYTTSSSYNVYSHEFHKKYLNYMNERDKRREELNKLKEQLKNTPIDSDEYKKIQHFIEAKNRDVEKYIITEFSALQIQMTRETAAKLQTAYNDLFAEYQQAISNGESAEVLKIYQDGLGEIADKITETNEEWLNAHETIRDSVIETAERAGDSFDSITNRLSKDLDEIDYKLEMLYANSRTPDVEAESELYISKFNKKKDVIKTYEDEKSATHTNADDLRRSYSDVIDYFGSDVVDKWFDVNGEIIQSQLNKSLSQLNDDSELKQRTKTLTEALAVYKQRWHTSDKEQQQAIQDLASIRQEAEDKLMDYEQKAHDAVVDMINKRKEKELEAIEEIHDKTTKLLNKRKKTIEDTYSRQLELLQDVKTEEDYQRELNDETDKLNQIQQEIDKYSLIDTNAARTKVSELKKQLQEQQDVINEKQRQKEYDDKVKALEEDRDLMLDNLEQRVEDENDAYDEIKEAIEDRYTEEKINAEATEALVSGKIQTLKDKTITSYDDIGNKGSLVVTTLTTAFDNFYTTSGTQLDELNKNELAAVIESFNTIINRIETIQDLIVSTDIDGTDYGIGSSNSADGSTWDKNEWRLRNETGFATSEIFRTYDVIANKEKTGEDPREQYEYLYHIAELEKERALNVIAQRKKDNLDISEQEEYLRYVCDILGEAVPKYHTGKIPEWLSKDEELSIIKKDELILTKHQTQSLLDKISDITALNTSLIPNLSNFLFKPPIINNTPTTSSIGDVYVNLTVPEGTKINKQLLNDFGTKILDGIRTELKVNI